ncbi:hypothetical protein CVT24_012211 [Panaeolus cyanescens]|uniref:Uncharacterized protein n=1 Tax=Panaeolus cyanescens TaxID=181874 RepID=A0A409YIV6_9AGAR|nr:hypothetical protein CVT24_012211 [Panaeolus cyanescens]
MSRSNESWQRVRKKGGNASGAARYQHDLENDLSSLDTSIDLAIRSGLLASGMSQQQLEDRLNGMLVKVKYPNSNTGLNFDGLGNLSHSNPATSTSTTFNGPYPSAAVRNKTIISHPNITVTNLVQQHDTAQLDKILRWQYIQTAVLFG